MGLRIWLVIGFSAISTVAVADPIWSDVEFYDVCGSNDADARYNARRAAEEGRDDYAAECEEDGGVFSHSISDGTCLRNQGDLTCPYECNETLRVSCEDE